MFHQLFPTFLSIALLVGLGYGLGKLHQVDLKSIAHLLIYGFVPVVVTGAVAQLTFTPEVLLLPVVGFALCCAVGFISLWLGRRLVDDKLAVYLLPITTGSGNTGFFGLPVALALLGNDQVGIYMISYLGTVIFGDTIGYYYVARGNLTVKDALRRVSRLPVLYGMAIGFVLSIMQIGLPSPLLKFWEVAKGAYICMGIMLVGLALASQRHFKWDYQLIGLGLFGKFIMGASIGDTNFLW